MKTDILGVMVDDVNMAEALSLIEKWIWNPGKHYIVTPNPEIIVAAQADPVFRKVLNEADLAVPDGVGLKFSGKVRNTLSGADLMEALVKLAAEKGFVISFLGGREGVAKLAGECLLKKYPGLKIAFAGSGGQVNNNGQITEENFRLPPTDILFVAFGHIKQEKWIVKNLDKIPAKLIMGVGGTFDYLSGMLPRAPVWLRSLGFEWLFRLAVQPSRITRQLALLKYLWLLIKVR